MRRTPGLKLLAIAAIALLMPRSTSKPASTYVPLANKKPNAARGMAPPQQVPGHPE